MLKIDSVIGVNRSIASVRIGNIEHIRPGELFKVSNWASSYAPLLKLFVPRGNYDYEEVTKLAQIDNQLKDSKKIVWINDLEKYDPYASVYFDLHRCFIQIDTAAGKELKNYSALNLISLCKKDSTLYFELPLPKDMSSTLLSKLPQNKSIIVVDDPRNANYVVYGTIDDKGRPTYGLRRMQTSAKDSLESMPLQTKSFLLSDNSKDALDLVADSLYEFAMKLSKIRGWLQLSGPKEVQNKLPYHLEFFDTDSGKVINTGRYRVKENISVHLVANTDFSRYTGGPRYVYIFGIDKSGRMYCSFRMLTKGIQ